MSNRLDCLVDNLINGFISTQGRTIIIIPSNTVKEFILQHFTHRLGFVFGIRFLTLPQAVEYFAKLTNTTTPKCPEHLPLMLHIESEIRKSRHPELLDYLQGDEEKIYSLAEEMSHIFLHYGLYGHKALQEWEVKEGWQQEIWRCLRTFWDFPCDFLLAKEPPKIPHVLHLFDLAHIPLLYSSFLERLSHFWPIYTYFRSPTPLYWGDLLSDKALAKSPELSAYKLETNPHLANLGTLGKRLYSHLAEKEFEEHYLPHSRDTALNNLKQDVFELTSQEHPSDETVEIHSCKTRLSEIEVLLENLEKAGCEDVLVLAPNINDYFPHIQFVFEQDDCPFGYLVTDLKMPSHRILDLFFSLVESRFEPKLILELFSSPRFKIKEDLSLLHKITRKVRWGYNQKMREEILECEGVSDVGTWDASFQSLIKKLAYPSSPIELSKAENFGNLIALLERLYADLWSLKNKKATLPDWIRTIEALLDKYFLHTEEIQTFLTNLRTCSHIEGDFSYPSIRRILRELLSEQKESRALLSKPAVRFASLKDGAISDADIICLLGLDEESFPRKNTFRSLNQLKGAKGADVQPDNSTKDRYLLLQAMLAARKRLLISYVNTAEDGKELGPSLLLEKLGPIRERLRLRLRARPCPHFSHTQTETQTLTEISLSSLAKLARNPLAFYCNESLGIYLDPPASDNEFVLSYQQKAELRNEALFKGVDAVLQNTNILFPETAKQELSEEVEELKSHLDTLHLKPNDFYSLRFDLSCQKPTKLSDGSTIFPPIQMGDMQIHGELARLTPKGLYVFAKESFAEYWKYLPHVLILAHLGLPTALLFGKEGKIKEFSPKKGALLAYLKYYKEALATASPLLPEQAEKLYKGKKWSPPSTHFEDPYIDFVKADLSKQWEDHFGELCANLNL